MGSAKRLVADDPEAASFRLKNDQAIQVLQPRSGSDRRRELHVSDFTAGDSEFCARKVLARWWRGQEDGFTSLIQRDGKFREQKWHEQFEAAGIVVATQPEYKLGLLVGHPDWVLDWGYGPRIVDLTGQDRNNDFIALARHTAMKKRQVRLYNVMSDLARGFVLIEDKGSCEYRLVPVERDHAEEQALITRVVAVSQPIQAFRGDPDEVAVVNAMRVMPRCGRKGCGWCAQEAQQDQPSELGAAPDAPEAGEASAAGVPEAEGLLELLDAGQEDEVPVG